VVFNREQGRPEPDTPAWKGAIMELQADTVDGVTVVTFKTEFLDANNGRAFKEKMMELLDHTSPKVLLDLGQVQFIDSTGCGALLTCLKRVSELGGDLRICSVTSPVRALFDLVRIQRIIHIYKTRAEGLQSFHQNKQAPE
jgi:anti-sigma B factor antagonist